MSTLLIDLQRDFLARLAADPATLPPAIDEGSPSFCARRRFGIYHHAYRARLTEVLQDVFERTWAYLGDAGFADCAARYLAAHPPHDPTLHGFGANFPSWLACEYAQDGDIAEIATIDGLLRRAFDGPDAEPLNAEALAALTAEDWAVIGFEFHPTLATTTLRYNAASLWEALEQGATPPPAVLLEVPLILVVWRKGWQPHFRTVGALEAAAMAALQAGTSFAGTCDHLQAQFADADIGIQTGHALRRWLDDGILAAIRRPY